MTAEQKADITTRTVDTHKNPFDSFFNDRKVNDACLSKYSGCRY